MIGGTNEHNGTHNHFGINDVVQNIIQISNDWKEEHPDKHILEINDISLPFGGKFDVNGKWNGAHQTHRKGRNVDIRSYRITTSNQTDYYVDINQNGVYDAGVDEFHKNTGHAVPPNYKFIDDLTQSIRAICQSYHEQPVLEHPNKTGEHFHLNYKD